MEAEELRNAYCGADAFAFFSYEETEGIVVLEALACEVPVVLRDILYIKDGFKIKYRHIKYIIWKNISII